MSTSLIKYKNNYQAGLLYIPMQSENSFDFNIDDSYKGDKDVVLKIYYGGDTAPQLGIKDPSNAPYTLVPYDYSKTQEDNNIAGANTLPGERENSETGVKEKYVYVTIPADKLIQGTWKVESNIPVSYTLLTVPTASPTLSNIRASKNGDENINVSWNAVAESDITVSMVPCDDSRNPIKSKVYDNNGIPVKDKDGKELLIDMPGYIIAQKKGNESLLNEKIPVIVPSGKYIIKIDSLLNSTMFVSAYGSDIIEFTNPKTLAQPTLTAEAIGNGAIKASAAVPPNATGVIFDIYLKDGDSEEKIKGFSGYIGDFDNKGEVSAVFRGETNILDSQGNVMGKVSIEPGKTYVIKATAVDLKEGSSYHKSDVTVSGPITIPKPVPPQANIKITSGDSEEKVNDRGIPYIQTNSNEFLIEYEITNYDENNPPCPNNEVDVRILIDNLQYGETLKNDATTGYKGYALTDITDGEHFVDLIFTNKDGDKTTITKKLSIDAIPADIKISSPMSGSKFDPTEGVLVDIISDARAKIHIYIDDVLVVEDDVNVSSGAYKKTIPINNPQYSHTVKIKATDLNGNSTEHIATVINKDIDDIEGIKLKAMKVAGSNSLQLNAVALNSNNDELLTVPKENLKWTLSTGDSKTALVVKPGNSCAVLTPGYESSDYAVMAELNIAPGYSFRDIYVSNIVGEKSEEDPQPPSGGGGSGSVLAPTYPNNINELIRILKANMSPSAKVETFKMYAHIDSKAQLADNIIYLSGNMIPSENYLVMGVDENALYYANTLGEDGEIISNVIEFITEKELSSFLIAIPFDKSIDTEDKDLGLYRYINYLNKWLYMGGEINKAQGVARLNTKYQGRYAALKNTDYKSFTDVPGRWSEVYIIGLSSAGLVDGIYQNNKFIFMPGKNTTRGEFVKMLVAAKGLDIGDTDVSMFADRKNFADWMIPYAAAAAKTGWLKGAMTSAGVEARLNDFITREDAMVLIYRAFFATSTERKAIAFLDNKDIASYAKNGVDYLTSIGVVNGYEGKTLKPKKPITREEVAKIIFDCIMRCDATIPR
ncbi:MAG: S-layer homology domain-containing protein [Syntrophomonadaceae bacterium]|nr:S-layer homology domain-containing protein [Syntrophomonadaceae bacterium]